MLDAADQLADSDGECCPFAALRLIAIVPYSQGCVSKGGQDVCSISGTVRSVGVGPCGHERSAVVISTESGAATSIGKVRRHNEDSLLAQSPVFLVADGMGGYAAGDVASQIVVDEFAAPSELQIDADWVVNRFRSADQRIRELGGGGTTVAGVAIAEQNGAPYWLAFNLGDSRVYLSQAGEVHQISVDHSVVQELVDAGELAAEDARSHPQRHIITKAVGAADSPDPDFWLIPAGVGDRVLLCSDGLTTEVNADEIEHLLLTIGSPQRLADLLVECALNAGGRDNVTAVVVDFRAPAGEGKAVEPPTIELLVTDMESTLPRLAPITSGVSADRRALGGA